MKIVLGVLIGGGVGFLLGYFGRCASGTCPLMSNPYIGTIFGAVIGAIIAGGL